MSIRKFSVCLTGFCFCLCVLANETDHGSGSRGDNRSKSKMVYRPPLENVTPVRVVGHSRDARKSLPDLYALAPEHAGYTVDTQPTLYWFQTKAYSANIEVGVLDLDTMTTLIRHDAETGDRQGLQKIKITQEQRSKLVKGKEYQWYVALIVNPDDRSEDLFASGRFTIIDTPPELIRRLANTGKRELARLFAQKAIWYDAFHLISELIELNPANTSLREDRIELLLQVELEDVAKTLAQR